MNKEESDEKIDLYVAYDCKLHRPGCVILQAAFGGSPSLARAFPTESWLVVPTPDLKKYKVGNREQLDKLIQLTKLSMNRR